MGVGHARGRGVGVDVGDGPAEDHRDVLVGPQRVEPHLILPGLIADAQIHGLESRRDWVLRHHLAEVDSPGAEQVGQKRAEPDIPALRVAEHEHVRIGGHGPCLRGSVTTKSAKPTGVACGLRQVSEFVAE